MKIIENKSEYLPIGSSERESKDIQSILTVDTLNIDVEKDLEISKERNLGNYITKNQPTKLGRTFAFLYVDGEPKIIIGPHYPFFLCLSSFISFMSILYFYFFWDSLNTNTRNITLCIYFIQIISYFYTSLANPGIPTKHMSMYSKTASFNVNNFRICKTCNFIMDLDGNTEHCDDCNICVEGNTFI